MVPPNRPDSSAADDPTELGTPAAGPVSAPWGKSDWLAIAAIFVAVFLAYQRVWHAGFIWDDNAHVTQPALRSLHGLGEIWFKLGATQQYYPLLHSFFWVEHRLFGDAPLGYHLVNVALHALNAILLGLVLRRLRVPGAWLAAGIFALHPVMVESVAWVTEQKNTLSALFYFATALAWLRFDETRRPRWYAAALGFFLLALMSKTVTATFPAAMLVVFWWRRGRFDLKHEVLPLVPFFVLGAASGLFTAMVERKLIGAEGAEFNFSFVERGLIAGHAISFYLGKLFWPSELIFIYPRWSISGADVASYAYPAAVLVGLAGCWMLRRRWRGPLATLLFFAGTLFPVLGFFNVFPFIYSFVADHFQYLAAAGLIAAVSITLATLSLRRGWWNQPPVFAGCVLLLAGLGLLTFRQTAMYRDQETLYRTTMARNPGCWMAYNNLGLVLADQNRMEEALALYEQATQIKPDYAAAHYNMGLAYMRLNRVSEAMDHYRAALRIQPGYAMAHNNLGSALDRTGRLTDAMEEYREALRLDPNCIEAHYNLGRACLQTGRLPESIRESKLAVALSPQFAEAYNNLGLALVGVGSLAEAISHYQAAVRIKPAYAEAWYNLGLALTRADRIPEAITSYEQAVKLQPDFAAAEAALAANLARSGNIVGSIQHYLRALQLNPGSTDLHFNLATALAAGGRLPDAAEELELVLKFRPDDAEVHCQLGIVLLQMQRVPEAIPHFEAAVAAKPNYALAQNNLGTALAQLGRIDEAIVHFQAALRINPEYASARQNLESALSLRKQTGP